MGSGSLLQSLRVFFYGCTMMKESVIWNIWHWFIASKRLVEIKSISSLSAKAEILSSPLIFSPEKHPISRWLNIFFKESYWSDYPFDENMKCNEQTLARTDFMGSYYINISIERSWSLILGVSVVISRLESPLLRSPCFQFFPRMDLICANPSGTRNETLPQWVILPVFSCSFYMSSS